MFGWVVDWLSGGFVVDLTFCPQSVIIIEVGYYNVYVLCVLCVLFVCAG